MSPDSIRVLHVDDEAEFVETAAAMLERAEERMSVETARSPQEALERLEDRPVDCIVSDYNMPGQNGIDFLEAVREQNPELPFILFTGRGSEEIASKAISAGVTDYLQKGTGTERYDLLTNRIENAVEGYRSRKLSDERKRRLETLISNLPGIVYRCRNEPLWPMQFVGGECEEITGYTAAELESGAVRWGEDVLHPDDREEMWERVQESLDAGDPFEVTYRIVTRGGETRWMWERGRSIDTDDGNPATIEGFITDITERREHKRQLQGVLDTVAAGIFMKDAEGRYLLMNKQAREWVGLDEDEDAVGMTDEDLFPDAPVEEFRADDRRVIQTGETIEIEEKIPSTDRTLLTRKSPVYDDEGDLYAVCAVSTDVTSQKERQRELERQNDRLDAFADMVSHDLRTPLSIASDHLALARESCDSDHIDRVDRAHERMETLIQHLLSLAREDEPPSETDRVDLAAVAERSWEGVRAPNATLSVEADRTIRADRAQLRQLLENLFRNAVEHGSREDTARVSVVVGDIEDGFYVADDGPGVPDTERDRIFESGYSTSAEGTGIGLSIVHSVADAHGWEVSVTEGPDGGARFEITGVET